MKSKYYPYIFYASVFLISLFLRLYHLKQLFIFTMDEEYQAYLVKNIISGYHYPLIGVNVAGTGLYLGSFFTWLSVIPYYLTNLNPIGTAYFAALLGALTS